MTMFLITSQMMKKIVLQELTKNIVEYLPVLIDKKLNLFSSKVNQS